MSIARVNTDYLTGAADAIRRKTGSQEAIPLPQFESEIDNIPTGWANPTSFAMVSDIQYADEVLPVFISACPDHGQWFIGKVDYANRTQTPTSYVCVGGYVIRSSDGMRTSATVLRTAVYWEASPVIGHYNAAVYAGDKFYIYDISSIPT